VLGLEPEGGLFAIKRKQAAMVAEMPPAAESSFAMPTRVARRGPAPPLDESTHHVEHAEHAPRAAQVDEVELAPLGALAALPAEEVDLGRRTPRKPQLHERSDTRSALLARLSELDWTHWALAGWAAGGLVLLALLALGALRLRDHLAGRRRLREGPLVQRLADLRRAAGIRRPVRLMVSPRIQAPIALGTLLPEICVPPRALDELTPPMQDAMLAHELAHIARFDPLWLGLCRWLETLLFFQPLNRLARRRLAESAEFLCDDRAVRWTGDSISLARCLAEVAGWLAAERRDLAPRGSLCGMAEKRSKLSERVTRILEQRSAQEGSGRGLLPVGAGVLGSVALLVPGFAREASLVAPALEVVESVVPEARPIVLPDRPEAPVRLVRTPWTGPVAPPKSDLAALLQELEVGLSGVEYELAVLREATSGKRVPLELARRMLSVEQRAASMRSKKLRIDSLMERLLAGDAAVGMQDSEEPLSGDDHE
jgi:beta-lactamase regulating signal transducer with metallopeptidase domain